MNFFHRSPEPEPTKDRHNGMYAGAGSDDALSVEPPVELAPEPAVEAGHVVDDEDAGNAVFVVGDADPAEDAADPGHLAWPTVPSGWSDSVTSTDGPRYWDRLLASERDRVRRYDRPATIVFIEIAGLDRLGVLWGDDVAAQSLVRVGRTVMQEIRTSDHAARIDVSRFAIFLPETTEIDAINFVERVRSAIDVSLGEMAKSIQIGIGWASPADGKLDVAIEMAEQRLEADLGTRS